MVGKLPILATVVQTSNAVFTYQSSMEPLALIIEIEGLVFVKTFAIFSILSHKLCLI